MRVKFKSWDLKIDPDILFDILKDDLKSWAEANIKSDVESPFEPIYKEGENWASLEHSTGNAWTVKLKDGEVYLCYEGSRLGFYAMTPWTSVLFKPKEDENAMEVFLHEEVAKEIGLDTVFECFIDKFFIPSKFYYVGLFNLIDYETTTPKEWGVRYYEVILPLEEEPDKAVIIDLFHGLMPHKIRVRRVVPYKNVYT